MILCQAETSTFLSVARGLSLKWTEVYDAANGRARLSFVREGKAKNARLNVSLTTRVQEMLVKPILGDQIEVCLRKLRGQTICSNFSRPSSQEAEGDLQLPKDFVIHSLRHSFFDEVR